MSKFASQLKALKNESSPNDNLVGLVRPRIEALAALMDAVGEVLDLSLQPLHDETEWSEEDLSAWAERANIQDILRANFLALEKSLVAEPEKEYMDPTNPKEYFGR